MFPDKSRNISMTVAPYRLPIPCECRGGLPMIYFKQKEGQDEESD